MSIRFDTPSPIPPKRSKSSIYTPVSAHRKLTSVVEHSLTFSSRSRKKPSVPPDYRFKQLIPEALPIKLSQIEEFSQRGRSAIDAHSYESAVSYFSTCLSLDNNHTESYYYRGMCYYKLKNFKTAIPDLMKVINTDPVFNKFSYYLLALCFEKIHDIPTAVRHISKCIYHFPKFSKAYVLRGTLLNAIKKYEKAVNDFKNALAININEGSALIGMAESLENIGDFDTAYIVLSQALAFPVVLVDALIKRGKLMLRQKKHIEALADFNSILEKHPSHSEAYYSKGKTLVDLGQYSEAALCFEQVAKNDSKAGCTAKAVYYLGYIKIKEKDFYGALHQFDRMPNSELEDQRMLRTYAEGVIYLIKRKFKEGIDCFNKIIRKKSSKREYVNHCYEHLAFAYCSLKIYSKALKYIKIAASNGELSKASRYNTELIQGFIHGEHKDYLRAAEFFKKASTIFPEKPEPFLLQALILLQDTKFPESIPQEVILTSEKLLSQASELRSDSESGYLQGVIRYLTGRFDVAVEDLKSCIEKADENVAEHYIMKGLCSAALCNYTEAIESFSVALQLDEELDYVYEFRGRCAYLIDDSDMAYSDFQKLVSLDEESPQPYLQTAAVLMHSSSFSGAIASLDNANIIKYTVEAGLLKAKAYILQYDMNAAINEFSTLLACDGQMKDVRRDRKILQFLSEISSENPKDFHKALNRIEKFQRSPGQIFDEKIINWYKGSFLLYLNRFDEAIAVFQKVIEALQKTQKKITSEERIAVEEQNCEILYNIALCYLKLNSEKAYEMFSDLSKILNKNHKGQLLFLAALVKIENSNKLAAEKLLEEVYRCNCDLLGPYLNKEQIIIMPLNTTNSFALTFPVLQPFTNKKISLRPAICLPKPELPAIEFFIEAKALEFCQLNKISPKPEPPWLKKSKGIIMFTENMIDIENEPVSNAMSSSNLNLKPTKGAKSGIIMKRSDSEKESANVENSDESCTDFSVEEIPDIVIKKIKEICC